MTLYKDERIVVLMGGWSPEREVSLKSGNLVYSTLNKLGYYIYKIDVKKDLRYLTKMLRKYKPDFIFNMLHGIGGEDGVTQGVLDVFGVPYSNSGVLASAITFDKDICKKIVGQSGVKILDWKCIHKIKDCEAMEYPFVVKPVANGSSVGVSVIFSQDDWDKIRNIDWIHGEEIMLEKYIKGRGLSSGVINGKYIGFAEIICDGQIFDYETKYQTQFPTHFTDTKLEDNVLTELKKMSEIVFKACKCQGVARIDWILDNKDLYFLEINTIPGMTKASILPDIAKANGISFEELLENQFEHVVIQKKCFCQCK